MYTCVVVSEGISLCLPLSVLWYSYGSQECVCVCAKFVSALSMQDVVMMCHEMEQALDRKLEDMPAQVSNCVCRGAKCDLVRV